MRFQMFQWTAAAVWVCVWFFLLLSEFETVCIPATLLQISLSLRQLSCLFNRRLCQWDTDIKDRLLHNQCLKCDYNQMCTQIISEAEDFVISHRCMLLEQSFMSCHQRESAHRRISAIWQKMSWTYSMIQKIQKEWFICYLCVWLIIKAYGFKKMVISGRQPQQWNVCNFKKEEHFEPRLCMFKERWW